MVVRELPVELTVAQLATLPVNVLLALAKTRRARGDRQSISSTAAAAATLG